MKSCPQCGKVFDGDLNFCLDDGTPLAEADAETVARVTDPGSEIPTVYRQPVYSRQAFTPPGIEQPGTRMRYLMPITLSAVGIVLLGAAGLGIYSLIGSRQATLASANVNAVKGPDLLKPGGSGINSSVASEPVNSSNANVATSGAGEIKTPTPAPTAKAQTPTPPKAVEPVSVPTPAPVPVAPEPQQPSRTVMGGILNGKAISLPQPAYPPAARAVNVSGQVRVRVFIDESGRVVSATAVNGPPLLRGAAEHAALAARFSPMLQQGQPVRVTGVIVYNFIP